MSIVVRDGNGTPQTIQTLPSVGPAASAGALPVVLATDSNHATAAGITSLSAAITGALAPQGGLPVALQGTVAVTQSGAWTVGLAPGATVALLGGNTVALKVDASATTQPISGNVGVTSLPALPAGSNAIGSVLADLRAGGAAVTTANPVPVNIVSGGSTGGGGNTATTSNATDGQATSATNQQNVVFGYIFNGTTWDRLRGTGGAANVAISGTPTVNLGTLNGAATATLQSAGNTTLSSILTALGTPLQAGGNVAVTALPPTPAGTNAIGSVLSDLRVGGAAVASGNPIPVSQASVPAGAATSTLQNTIITNQNATAAGTSAANAQAIQGVTGGVPVPTIGAQASNIATGQVAVAATAGGTQIVPARVGRRSVVITQEGNGSGGTGTLVRLGASGVTTATGAPLPGNAYSTYTIDGGAAVFGITASGTQTVSYMEIY